MSLPVLRKRHQVPTGLAAEAVDYSKPSNAKITLHSLLCGLLRKLNVLLAVLPVHFMVPTKPVESSRNWALVHSGILTHTRSSAVITEPKTRQSVVYKYRRSCSRPAHERVERFAQAVQAVLVLRLNCAVLFVTLREDLDARQHHSLAPILHVFLFC